MKPKPCLAALAVVLLCASLAAVLVHPALSEKSPEPGTTAEIHVVKSDAVGKLGLPLPELASSVGDLVLADRHVRVLISYPTPENHSYIVEYRDSLDGADPSAGWQQVPNAPHNQGALLDTSSSPQRFYRIRQIDPLTVALSVRLENDTGKDSGDGVTSDPTIIVDVGDLGVPTDLEASIDSATGPFTVVVPNARSRQQYRIDRASLLQASGGALQDGQHTLHLQKYDEVRNILWRSLFPFVLDASAPETAIDSGPTPRTASRDASFAFSGSDNLTPPEQLSFELRVIGPGLDQPPPEFISGASPYVLSGLSDGEYRFEVRAVDLAGNSDPSPEALSWTVAASSPIDAPPETVITETPPVLSSSTSASFEFSGSDDTTPATDLTFQSKLDDGDFVDSPSPKHFSDLPDGPHTFSVRAIDAVGNADPTPAAYAWTIDTTPPPLILTLDPDHDSPPVGDLETTFALVNLIGETEPNLLVTLSPGGVTVNANEKGKFAFSGVELSAGPNSFTAHVLDSAGNETTAAVTVTLLHEGECTFDSALTGWTITQNGGSTSGKGGVTASNCEATMTEGDSFLVTLQKVFEVPTSPSALAIKYSHAFDPTAEGRIKDAFEACIVDADNRPLSFTITSARDSLFNATDGQPEVRANGTTFDNSTISIDLSHLTAGSSFRLILRLINNDADTSTSVRISGVRIQASSGPSAGEQPSIPPMPAAQVIDLSSLSDVTSSVALEYGRTSFERKTYRLFSDLALRNVGTFSITKPLVAIVTAISDPSVRVLDANGLTPDGFPYYSLSDLILGTSLEANQATSPRTIAFSNPNRLPFTYRVIVMGQLNRMPLFTSTPVTEALVGKGYTYKVTASDPDSDPLAFSVILGPRSMEVDPATGAIAWIPSAQDVGSHSVKLRVEDAQGGFAEQSYIVSVIDLPPNRPPNFTSFPTTSATVSTNQIGNPEAFDLSHWSVVQFDLATQGAADWILSDGNSVATQIRNADASILLSDASVESAQVEGAWLVAGDGDDDYMGFVFGYQDQTHFYLFDWKRKDQSDPCGNALAGMNVRVVSADSDLGCTDFWPTAGVAHRVRNLYHNSISWENGVEYAFSLRFAPGLISILVWHGADILATIRVNDSTYASGKFGFYNYSQGTVRYTGFTRRDLPAPTYVYNAKAIDPDGDSLTFTLVAAPTGMSLDPNSGQLQWGPTVPQVGVHKVSIQVCDGRGGTATQSYILSVLPDPENHSPIIVSDPLLSAAVGSPYTYAVVAHDPDGDPLTYSLAEKPQGMAMDNSQEITWVPASGQIGSHEFTVRVADDRGGVDVQTVQVRVSSTPVVDLVVEDVNISGLVVDGQNLTAVGTLSAVIKNIGSEPAVDQPFEVVFFDDVNHNSAYDAGTDTLLGTLTVNQFLGGAALEVSAAVTARVSFPGIFVWAFVDSGNVVSEIDEENNLTKNQVHCSMIPPSGDEPSPAPDLTVSYLRVSKVGETATMTVRVGNGGSIAVEPGVAVGFYDGNPHSGGTLLGFAETTKSILAGDFEDISLAVASINTTGVWVAVDYLESTTFVVPATANIFGSGHAPPNDTPNPSGDGGGTAPLVFSFDPRGNPQLEP